jgi:hypothetical protein
MEQEIEQKEEDSKVDSSPLLSAESRLDNLLLNSEESKAGRERDEETQVTESKGRGKLGTNSGVLSSRNDKSLAVTGSEYHGPNA